jgi:hypothetical protein
MPPGKGEQRNGLTVLRPRRAGRLQRASQSTAQRLSLGNKKPRKA